MRPFEIELDCGSPSPVKFTLTEERIRSAGPKVQSAIADDEGNPDDRTRLWRGAVQIARNIVERTAEETVTIHDGADTWIIPEKSIRWVRLREPETSPQRARTIGFHFENPSPEKSVTAPVVDRNAGPE